MKRLIDWHLEKWKGDRHRKPLIIRGARQVGKTYAVRKLGRNFENFVLVMGRQRASTIRSKQ